MITSIDKLKLNSPVSNFIHSFTLDKTNVHVLYSKVFNFECLFMFSSHIPWSNLVRCSHNRLKPMTKFAEKSQFRVCFMTDEGKCSYMTHNTIVDLCLNLRLLTTYPTVNSSCITLWPYLKTLWIFHMAVMLTFHILWWYMCNSSVRSICLFTSNWNALFETRWFLRWYERLSWWSWLLDTLRLDQK